MISTSELAVDVNENAFGRHNDGSAFLVPTGIAIARRARAAKSDIIGAMRNSFFIEARLQRWRKFTGLLAGGSE